MNTNNFLGMLNEEQKKALLEALLNNAPADIPKPSTSSARVDENFRVNRQDNNVRRREPVRARNNEWTDNGEDRHIETPKFEKVPRKRNPYTKVEVECHVCGKKFKEDPSTIYGEYYRCSRCIGG